MGDIFDNVKAKQLKVWQQNTSEELVKLYFNCISYDDFNGLDAFVVSNFRDREGFTLFGIDDVWDRYLQNGKDPSDPNSPDWRIYHEFEDSTSRLGLFLGRLMEDVTTKFWHDPNQPPTQAEEEKIGHVCGILAIQAAYKSGKLFTDMEPGLKPSTLHTIKGGVPPEPSSTPVQTDPPPISLDEVLLEYLTPLGQDQFHAVVDGNENASAQYQEIPLRGAKLIYTQPPPPDEYSTSLEETLIAAAKEAPDVYGEFRPTAVGEAGILPDDDGAVYDRVSDTMSLVSEAASDNNTTVSESTIIIENLSDDQKADIWRKVREGKDSGEASEDSNEDGDEDGKEESEKDGENEHGAGGSEHVH